jgi:phosphonate transport system substrate-binding protein
MKKIAWSLLLLGVLSGCTRQDAAAPDSSSAATSGIGAMRSQERHNLAISAIPDQDPEKLQRLYGKVADYLSKELGVPVEYKPVTDYAASITAFKVGDLDLVWYGGLTGVQARLQVPGAHAIAQRDIDKEFRSVFIANNKSDIKSLSDLKGHTFTFGSESSTSGRLMPQYFLNENGIKLTDFKGEPGFSGTHDKTLALVAAGSYDAGALNEQVWKKRSAAGGEDIERVHVIYTTPPYFDYHWVLQPEAAKRLGGDAFVKKLQAAFFKLDPKVPAQAEILDLFGAKKFISTKDENYRRIEQIGRETNLIAG